MNKMELRTLKRSKESVAGNFEKELEEIMKYKEANYLNDIMTITVTCGGLLTLICC